MKHRVGLIGGFREPGRQSLAAQAGVALCFVQESSYNCLHRTIFQGCEEPPIIGHNFQIREGLLYAINNCEGVVKGALPLWAEDDGQTESGGLGYLFASLKLVEGPGQIGAELIAQIESGSKWRILGG